MIKLKQVYFIFSLLLSVNFIYAAEPIEGGKVNSHLLAQVKKENELVAKKEKKEVPSRLPASINESSKN